MIHCQLLRDRDYVKEGRTKILPFFNEELYTHQPTAEFPLPALVVKFLRQVFDVGQFHPECCVIALIYINRLVSATGLPLTASNWKPVIITALVVAQKVWDDTPLINSDFSILYPPLNINAINALERVMLDILEFKLTVSPALYAQYVFELRSVNDAMNPGLATANNNKNRQVRLHWSEYYTRKKKEYKKRIMTTSWIDTREKYQILN